MEVKEDARSREKFDKKVDSYLKVTPSAVLEMKVAFLKQLSSQN